MSTSFTDVSNRIFQELPSFILLQGEEKKFYDHFLVFIAKLSARSELREATRHHGESEVSHARRILFAKLKKIKDFLNRYATMMMKNEK